MHCDYLCLLFNFVEKTGKNKKIPCDNSPAKPFMVKSLKPEMSFVILFALNNFEHRIFYFS